MARRERLTEAEIDALHAALSGCAGGGFRQVYMPRGPQHTDPATIGHTPATSRSEADELDRRAARMREMFLEAARASGLLEIRPPGTAPPQRRRP
jgi:hypothetical protein